MRRFNLSEPEFQYDTSDPDGYRAGTARFGELLGARRLGGTVYDLPPDQSICPYHYHHGDEELLLVLEGRVSVRHPDGEDELERGDVVCFPDGPEGAHKVTNRSNAPARVLMLSTQHEPVVSVYPDSDKIGVWTGRDKLDSVLVRRESRTDYWDRE
jgi:uncharacterized cupin superfamily protein